VNYAQCLIVERLDCFMEKIHDGLSCIYKVRINAAQTYPQLLSSFVWNDSVIEQETMW
jgi:hypothetical protein